MQHDDCSIGVLIASVERDFGGLWGFELRLGAPDASMRRLSLAARPDPDALAAGDLLCTLADLPGTLPPGPARLRARMAAACSALGAAWATLGSLGFDPPGAALDGWLRRRMGIAGAAPLLPPPPRATVSVYLPAEALAPVREAVWSAGAGVIGAYDRCSFAHEGTGTYRPLASADPYRGSAGRDEQAGEWRLEFQCSPGRLDGALRAMLAAHPYEEVAYAVVPAGDWPAKGRGHGRLAGELALYAGDAHAGLVERAFSRGARRLLSISADAAARAAALDCGLTLEPLPMDEMEREALAFLAQRLRSHLPENVIVTGPSPGSEGADVQSTRLP